MEYLDYYDENGNYLGYETRENVHKNALWHNTVHCWLYDLEGNVYFQIRKDTNTFYTTASGHVLKGETIKEAFKREIEEEIGLSIDSSDATLVGIVPFKMDKTKSDGSIFRDRAKANVYIDLFEGTIEDLIFDPEEVLGLVKVNAKNTLELFKKGFGKINATLILCDNGKNKEVFKEVGFDEFLVNKGETAINKYGDVLNKIIEVSNLPKNGK